MWSKTINFISLLILVLTLSGCESNEGCVEPGQGAIFTKELIKVPVKTNPDGSMFWYDSGIDYQGGLGEIEIESIEGSINLCEVDNRNPKELLAYNTFCGANLDLPDYSVLRAPDSEEVKYGFPLSLDHDKICPMGGYSDGAQVTSNNDKRYINSGMKVSQGDSITISLIPNKLVIKDCGEFARGKYNVSTFNIGERVEECIGSNVKCLSSRMVTVNEAFLQRMCSSGILIKYNNKVIEIEKLLDRELISWLSSSFTPYSNKVYLYCNGGYRKGGYCPGGGTVLQNYFATTEVVGGAQSSIYPTPWFGTYLESGDISDINKIKTARNKFKGIADFNALPDEIVAERMKGCFPDPNQSNGGLAGCEGLPAIDVNRKANLLSTSIAPTNINGPRIETSSEKAACNSALESASDPSNPLAANSVDLTACKQPVTQLSSLFALISGPGSEAWCLGKNGDDLAIIPCSKNLASTFQNDLFFPFKDSAYQIHGPSGRYISQLPLQFTVADSTDTVGNVGGYHIKVEHSCAFSRGQKLYLYIGGAPPSQITAAEEGTVKEMAGFYHDPSQTFEEMSGGRVGRVYFGIRDVDSSQLENLGQYYNLTLKVSKANNVVSSVLEKLKNKIIEIFYGTEAGQPGVIEGLFGGLARGLRSFVSACLALYLIVFALSILLGLVNKLDKMDILTRFIKIGLVSATVSNNGWEFLTTNFFNAFINGVESLVKMFSGFYNPSSNIFSFLDVTLGQLFIKETWLRVLSLFFTGPIGWLVCVIVLYSILQLLRAMCLGAIKYIMAMVVVAFLIFVSPIFFICMLFRTTAGLFQGWLRMLVGSALQPLILFSGLALLNQFLMTVFFQVNNFEFCNTCFLRVPFSNNLCIFNVSTAVGGGNMASSYSEFVRDSSQGSGTFLGLPFSMVSVILLALIAKMIDGYIDFSEYMSSVIIQMLTDLIKDASEGATEAIKTPLGLDKDTQQLIENARNQKGPPANRVSVANQKVKEDDPKNSPQTPVPPPPP